MNSKLTVGEDRVTAHLFNILQLVFHSLQRKKKFHANTATPTLEITKEYGNLVITTIDDKFDNSYCICLVYMG